MNETIRVILVDDEASVRKGVRLRLELEPDIEVVGEAADGPAAIDLVGLARPAVAVIDVEMPGQDGMAATAAIRSMAPGTYVVILSIHDDDRTQARALAAGAAAFVSKTSIDGALVESIRRAAQSAQETPGVLE